MKKITLVLLLLVCKVTIGQVCFTATTSPAILYAKGSTAGDFNNDGNTDLAIASNASNSVSILMGQGNGLFNPAVNYAVGPGPYAVKSADFNGDTYPDLVVTGSGTVSVLLGSAGGTFGAATHYSVSGNQTDVVTGDFNNNGSIDFATANSNGFGVNVFFNSGTGTFGTTSAVFNTGSYPHGLATADFNGDGRLDLAVGNTATSNNVSILLGAATGTFATAVNYFAGSTPFSVAAKDFNGDGYPDIAVVNNGSNNVSVLLGSATGTFGTATNYTVDNSPNSIVTGDFNGDSKPDLAISNGSSNDVSVLLGSNSGTFAASLVGVGVSPQTIVAADFNNDSFSDFATGNYSGNNISVLLRSTIPLMISATSTTNCPSVNTTLTASGAATYTWSTGSNASSILVYPFTTTTYTVAGTAAGCTAESTITIYVNPNPNPSGTTNSPLCTGAPINFINNSTGAATYTWTGPASFSSTLQNPSILSATTANNGTYTLAATSSMGCTATNTLIVNVNASPTVAISVTNGTFCPGGTATLNANGANSFTWTTGSNANSIMVSPASTTGYTVTGANGVGCTDVKSVTVTVNPTPVISVNSGSICTGQSFTMTPSGASSYTYSNGSNIVSPAATTSYSVTGTSAAGCVGTNTAVSTVTVNAIPTVAVNSGTLCSGNAFTITPSGASSYTITGGSNIVSPTANTDYSVTGTSAQGCVSTNTAVSSLTVYTTPVLAVNSGSICSGNAFTITPSGASTYTINGGVFTVSPMATTNYSVTGTSGQGCVASNTAISSVTVNATPTITVNNGTICAGNSFTINANGATTYTWNTSATTQSIVVSPLSNTSYTVVGASAANCTSTAIQTLVVNALPVLTVSATSTLICSGQSSTITASGANTYTWEPGTVIASSVNATPLANTDYTVTGESVDGCTATAVSSLSVNITPTLTIAATSQTLCAGAVATITPGGAATYSLNPGNMTGTGFTVNPSATVQYSLTGVSTNGCYDAGAALITITVNPLTAIAGLITTAPSVPVAGAVKLYAYESFLTSFDLVATQAISATGTYTFASIPPGVYIIQANPTSNTLQVTYGSSSVSWQSAATFTHGCAVNAAQNIDVMPITNIGTGPGSLRGTIREGVGFGQKPSGVLTPGNPIGGVIVKGGRNPGGDVVAQSITSSSGEYVLDNIPLNGPNDSYFVIVEIPGLDTTNTYHRIIFNGSENYINLDFTVDNEHIVPDNLTVGIREVIMENSSLLVYPNPASNNITISCDLKKQAVVNIELIDLTGRSVQTLLPQGSQAEGTLQVVSGINDVKAGIYFVKIKVNNEVKTTKIVVTR